MGFFDEYLLYIFIWILVFHSFSDFLFSFGRNSLECTESVHWSTALSSNQKDIASLLCGTLEEPCLINLMVMGKVPRTRELLQALSGQSLNRLCKSEDLIKFGPTNAWKSAISANPLFFEPKHNKGYLLQLLKALLLKGDIDHSRENSMLAHWLTTIKRA